MYLKAEPLATVYQFQHKELDKLQVI